MMMNIFLTCSMLALWLTTSAVAYSMIPQEGRTLPRAIKIGNLQRTYYLHVPKQLPKDKSVPLVLMFHGGGGTPTFAERESKFSELADREGFLVAYPEGIGKGWNDGRGGKAIPAQRQNADDVGFIAALIDDVTRDYNVDVKRVYSTGISNGGIFSHFLGVMLSSRIAAIAPVVGGLAKPVAKIFHPERPVSVLIIQGTADPLVPYKGGDITLPFGLARGSIIATEDAVMKWVEHNACERTAIEVDVANTDPNDGCNVKKFTYPNGNNGAEVILYRMEGAGHAWPNGQQYLPERLIGKVCRDFSATEVIWDFFKRHAHP